MPFHRFDEQDITWLQGLFSRLVFHKPASLQDEHLMFPFMLMQGGVPTWFDFKQAHREVLRTIFLGDEPSDLHVFYSCFRGMLQIHLSVMDVFHALHRNALD